MNRSIRNTLVAAALALPFAAFAQATAPADQPRTNLEKQQTEQQGDAPKYGEQGSTAGTTQKNRKDSKQSKDSMSKSSKTTKPNDDSSTPTPMNTVSPTTTK